MVVVLIVDVVVVLVVVVFVVAAAAVAPGWSRYVDKERFNCNAMNCLSCQENTPDAERTTLIRENIYVRAHGHVRSFGGKRSVVAFRVSPLIDINEITTHVLEVIHAHVYLTRSGGSSSGGAGGTPMV